MAKSTTGEILAPSTTLYPSSTLYPKGSSFFENSQILYLFEFEFISLDGLTTEIVRFTDNELFITKDTNLYTPMSISFNEISEDFSLQADTVEILVDNIDNEITNRALEWEWRNNTGKIYRIVYNELPQDVPPDYFLDDSIYGLTTQQAHSKGDIVVTGNELVTNGTFDSDVSGWIPSNDATLSVDTNRLKITGATTNYPFAYQIISTIVGQEYYLTFHYDKGTDNGQVNIGVGIGGSQIGNVPVTSSGDYSLLFIAATTSTYVSAYLNTTNDNAIGYFDNISVTLKDNTYRATRDTADMYDYELKVGTGFSVGPDDVVFINDNTITDAQYLGFYKRINTSGSNTVSTATTFDSNSNWQYLGTADNMSLLNPYFQILDKLPVFEQGIFSFDDDYPSINFDNSSYDGIHYMDLIFEGLMDDLKSGSGSATITLTSELSMWDSKYPEQTYDQGQYENIINAMVKELNWGAS